MEVLQWIFIIGVAITIISIIFVLYFLLYFVNQTRKLKKIQTKRNSKKQKRLIKDLQQTKKSAIKKILGFTAFAILVGSLSGYTTYYQATNLSEADMSHISDGFYYLRDLEEELKQIQEDTTDEEQNQQTINFVVTSLAGYSVIKANTLNTIEGQRILNRYYSAMAELGINISRNSLLLSTDEKIMKESLEDIAKVQSYQKKALDFFKVDKSALEAQK